jgi:hypothetical protein
VWEKKKKKKKKMKKKKINGIRPGADYVAPGKNTGDKTTMRKQTYLNKHFKI